MQKAWLDKRASLETGEKPPEPRCLLVTGGCGFIASNFINRAARRWPHCRIVNVDRLDPGSNACNVALSVRASARYHLVTGDLANQRLILKTLTDHKVDTLINFAANSHVDECYRDPVGTTRNNVLGMIKLLEAVREYGQLRKLVHISTDEVYGDSEEGEETSPKTETTALAPTNPYSASKAACEALLNAYTVSYHIPALTVRMNNVYGPRQWETKVVPLFIKQAQLSVPFTVMGDGGQLRSWMFVDDACEGIAVVTEKGRDGQVYNLGTHTEISIRELAHLIHQEVNRQMERAAPIKLERIPDRPYNDRRYFIDFGKVKRELGWQCRVSFPEGLRATVSWYLNPMKDTMTEHVMVYGGNGWVGKQFSQLLHETNTSHSLALTRPGHHKDEEVETELIKISPTHVISFLGRTHGPGNNSIEYLEGGPERLAENLRDNLHAPWLLATICERLGIHFTYVGTGCLFQYDQAHPIGGAGYGEDDVPNYMGNSYGVVKAFTDRMMHHFPNTLNARIRLPVNYQLERRNLLVKVASFSTVVDVPDNLSVLPTILPPLLELMQRRHTGTINLVNPGTIRHSETLNIYKTHAQPDKEWETLDTRSEKAQAMLASRSHCALDTAKLQELFPKIPAVHDAIETAVKEIALKMHKLDTLDQTNNNAGRNAADHAATVLPDAPADNAAPHTPAN